MDKVPPAAVNRRGRLQGIHLKASWYKMPSRWWMTTNYLPAIAKMCRNRVRSELKLTSPHVSITTDGWASKFAGQFQSLTGRSVVECDDGWLLKA